MVRWWSGGGGACANGWMGCGAVYGRIIAEGKCITELGTFGVFLGAVRVCIASVENLVCASWPEERCVSRVV